MLWRVGHGAFLSVSDCRGSWQQSEFFDLVHAADVLLFPSFFAWKKVIGYGTLHSRTLSDSAGNWFNPQSHEAESRVRLENVNKKRQSSKRDQSLQQQCLFVLLILDVTCGYLCVCGDIFAFICSNHPFRVSPLIMTNHILTVVHLFR